ncbi:major facilitator superfamily transporter [Secundilactobacillus pentosiphilus]|uniref:Major facilitator superfamily transporter n=1 Tax=Secundilactobacillus pentosiphilus TaxID=1714682 RepID=A0A1Z5ILJ4_9LACO|nr:MFS transporter [Secundilactobacillus pentosiphilus]GAX02518.1 major facilitator superfamily transporter [Secundilactobacillus pentosiphilus]
MLTNRFSGRTKTLLTALGVLQIYFACIAANVMDPALQNLTQVYPGISHEDITSLITIPSLAAIPASIISGLLTGRRVKYRTTLSISFTLIVLSGSAPMFLNSFSAVIGARIVLGFGLGLLYPLGNALIIDLFSEEKRAFMFGIGEVVKNLSLIMLQMLVGILVGVSIKISWSAYLAILISFGLLILFLPEPKVKPLEEQMSLVDSFKAVPKRLYVFVVFLCICAIMQTVYQVNLSSIIITEHLGNATTAATVLSTATFVAMFAALSFGWIQKYLKNYTITFCVFFLGLGSLLISLAKTLPFLYFAAGVVGIGIGTMSSAFYMKIAGCANNENAALISGFQVVFQGFGNFLPHYYLKAVHVTFNTASFRLPITIGSIVLFAVAIGFGVFYFFNNRRVVSHESVDYLE